MRFRTDTRGLDVAKLFFTFVTSAGLGLSMGTSFLIIRGPFLGGPSLDPLPMMAALAVFVTSTVMLTWGSTRLFGMEIDA